MPDESDSTQPAPGFLRGWLDDLHLAAGFLTRVVPPPAGAAGARPLAQAARAFPLVGAFLGLGAAIIYALADGLGLTPPLSAVCALAGLVLATGALHEDGLADVADGFGGGDTRDDKLAIMRQGASGAFGVIAVALGVVARVAVLAALAGPGVVAAALVASGAASRAAIPAVMLRLSPARADGLGAAAGVPTQNDVVVGVAIAGVAALALLGIGTAIVALALGALAAAGVALLARRQIGGFTGDVLGAVQQATEIVILLALVALG
ncbi:MAG: adenosylcobinamide-GDP ribazoletransferase [Alphaproteobacteria bacterium]